MASQTTLYDKNKAISAAEQATWRPTIVFNQIKQHLIGVGEDYNMTFEEEKLNKCVKRLMDMAVDYNQSDWLPEIRTILMEELDMPREMVYLQIVAGDTYIKLNEINWGGSEAIMAAVGQSITSVTPVALARYVAAVANGLCEKGKDVTVRAKGGDLIVNYTDERVTLTGDAKLVYTGEAEY